METPRVAIIKTEEGDTLAVRLYWEGERQGCALNIDGINYHFERLRKDELVQGYLVDQGDDYEPQSDAEGFCYILAPFCRM